MINASISDEFPPAPDRNDRRFLVTVEVSVDVLPEYAQDVLAGLVKEARTQQLRAVEPPF